MTAQTYAHLDSSNNVINTIIWDGVAALNFPAGETAQTTPALDGTSAQSGGKFNGTSFVAPILAQKHVFNGTYAPITITNGSYTITQANDLIEVNQTTGAPISIILPTGMVIDHQYNVVDAKGDSSTNNITVTTANGDNLINGASNYILQNNNQSNGFTFDGSTTKVV